VKVGGNTSAWVGINVGKEVFDSSGTGGTEGSFEEGKVMGEVLQLVI
jgi:hypothetical protein